MQAELKLNARALLLHSDAIASMSQLPKSSRRPHSSAHRSMFVGDERLDAARRAHGQHPDDDAAEHEELVKQARADRAEPQQSGDRPAAGERGAEHFGADED